MVSAAGRTAVRFSHYEIEYGAGRVEAMLTTVIRRLTGARDAA